MKIFFIFSLCTVLASTLSAQEKPEKENRYFIELRSGSMYHAGEAEFSRRFLQYFSGNVIFVFYSAGVRTGISVHPLSFLYFQSAIGVTNYRSEATDGPRFTPDYCYSLAGGVRIPLGTLPLAFSVSYETVTMVQNDYNPNGGLVPPDYVSKPHRTEKVQNGSISVGVLFNF